MHASKLASSWSELEEQLGRQPSMSHEMLSACIQLARTRSPATAATASQQDSAAANSALRAVCRQLAAAAPLMSPQQCMRSACLAAKLVTQLRQVGSSARQPRAARSIFDTSRLKSIVAPMVAECRVHLSSTPAPALVEVAWAAAVLRIETTAIWWSELQASVEKQAGSLSAAQLSTLAWAAGWAARRRCSTIAALPGQEAPGLITNVAAATTISAGVGSDAASVLSDSQPSATTLQAEGAHGTGKAANTGASEPAQGQAETAEADAHKFQQAAAVASWAMGRLQPELPTLSAAALVAVSVALKQQGTALPQDWLLAYSAALGNRMHELDVLQLYKLANNLKQVRWLAAGAAVQPEVYKGGLE